MPSQRKKQKPNKILRELERHRKESRKTKFKILIWGPTVDGGTQPSNIVARKRVEIRQALDDRGHEALFSEDLIVGEPKHVSLPEREKIHALVVDWIVMLYGSKGTHSEFVGVLSYKEFADKALVFVHADEFEKAVASLDRAQWQAMDAAGRVVRYTSEQIEACEVVAMTLAELESLQYALYIHDVMKDKKKL